MSKRSIFLGLFLTLTACTHSHPVREAGSFPALPLAQLKSGVARSHYEKVGTRYMVSTQGDATSDAAAEMLEAGGNVVDAATAATFAISVERPQSTGIGGGGFLLLHMAVAKKTYAVDFREQAPAAAKEKMFLDKAGNVVPNRSLDTPLSNAVPGLVAGILEVHSKFGRLPLEKVMEPAIRLAKNGFKIYPELAASLEDRAPILKKYSASRAIFLHMDGSPKKAGEILVQTDLANTLTAIAKGGSPVFYRGSVAKKIIEAERVYGGLITEKDLENYKVVWREPVWGTFHNQRVASMPPPSSGGVHVIQILNILETMDLRDHGPMAPSSIHATAAAMQRAFADRATHLGDPDFISVPVQGLVAKDYAAKLRDSILVDLATPSSRVTAGNPWPWNPPKESPQTTHFTIMDAEGNTVSSTQTINTEFGSGMVADGTGIVMNNEMDDFSAKPGAPNAFGAIGGKSNAIAPGKRPLSSMSPTIVFDESGSPLLALGSPSGTRIITCVAQTILNYFEYHMPLYESVASVRYHHQWSPDEIRMEPPGLPAPIVQKLRGMGYSVREQDLGCKVSAVARNGSKLTGVADPRAEGKSVGK